MANNPQNRYFARTIGVHAHYNGCTFAVPKIAMTLSPHTKSLLLFGQRLGHITMLLTLGYLCLLGLDVMTAMAVPHLSGDHLLEEVKEHGWKFIPLLVTLAAMLSVCTWMLGKFPPEEDADKPRKE